MHRPYSLPKNRRKYPPSVTTILDALSIGDGLKWWAARLTAEFAVDQQHAWIDLDRDSAFDKLYRVHVAATSAASERGTILHSINEAWSAGQDADIEAMVYAAANRDKSPVKSWQGREHLVAKDIDVYADGLERFWCDHHPETVGSEEVVLQEGRYIGQRDWTARLPALDGVTLLDIKSIEHATDPADAMKGVHVEKFALQLAAYRGAKQLVDFDGDGVEVGRRDAYPINHCAVLVLRPDGEYQLIELKAGGDELAHFYRLCDLYHYRQQAAKKNVVADHTVLLATRDEETAA